MAMGCGEGLRGLIAVATVVAATAFAAAGHAQQPRSGGSLSISIEADLPTLDPTGFASVNDREAGIILYDTPLHIDPKGKNIPHPAQKFEAAPHATRVKGTLDTRGQVYGR